jgi:hypothetical protein
MLLLQNILSKKNPPSTEGGDDTILNQFTTEYCAACCGAPGVTCGDVPVPGRRSKTGDNQPILARPRPGQASYIEVAFSARENFLESGST